MAGTWKYSDRICDEEGKDMLKWWTRHEQHFPCLRVVAFAVNGFLPGSGGLECDIGSFKDIITAKRSRLSSPVIEVLMMIKLNKTLNTSNTNEIPRLSDDMWGRHWPKGRPELPPAYFVAMEADEQLFQAQRHHEGELELQEPTIDDLPESSDDDDDVCLIKCYRAVYL
jgi:hypothetical protein